MYSRGMGMRWGAWLAPCSILLVLACSETHGLGKKSPARDAGAHDAGATGPLAGSACEYLCGGIACDLRCDGDDLYRCQA
ncbi:MAG TPA: hypothetical protein VHM19_08315, partial [Polyangiales bacterium]|nr:hypothetical protein [Polyangiales bacterium]